MHYLLLGDDPLAKDKKLAEIKNKELTSPEAVTFDFEVLYAPKIDIDELKKSLLSLPVIATQRIVVIRSFQAIKEEALEMVCAFLERKDERLSIVLDVDGELGEKILKKLQANVKILQVAAKQQKNIFDVTNALGRGQMAEALEMLNYLLLEGNHPLQLMGGLIWFWGKSKPRLSARDFQKGLRVLKEADASIKRSRLKPEYVLEVSVVKLGALLTAK